MATTNIAADIQNITGVTTANAQFLVSAQKFVVSSIPKTLMKWAGTNTVLADDGGDDDPTAVTLPQPTDNILDVQRNGFSAREVAESKQGFIANTSSIHLATKTFPKYYIDAGSKVIVKPDPTASETVFVNYVDFLKIDDDCDLRNAVIFYAVSSEFSKLASSSIVNWSSQIKTISPEAPSFSIPTIGTITVASTTLSNIGVPPTYTSPTVTGNAGLTGMEAGTITDATDQIEFDTWWDTLGDMIETEEDTELAAAQIQKINSYISAFQSEVQDALNTFNDANVEYQTKLQEGIQQAQIDAKKAQQQAQLDSTDAQQETSLLLQKENQEYANKLQKYSAELVAYQAEVGEEAQKLNSATSNAAFYSGEAKKYYDWAQKEVASYMSNNSKMIGMAMATQASGQQERK